MDLSTSPSQSAGRISPALGSPTSAPLRLSNFFNRARPRSNTRGNNNLPSPTSDTEGGRTSYFRVRIGRSGSVGNRERSLSESAQPIPSEPTTPSLTTSFNPLEAGMQPTNHSIRLVPHLELSQRSLHFEPLHRKITQQAGLQIGRFNERINGQPREERGDLRVTFRSKVVSRTHAEIQVDATGRFWVKDTKSSSGTFLNHIRLSAPGLESRLYPLADGDVLQLGVDYQGGTEEMYRCVKFKVELNRGTPKASNMFKCVSLFHYFILIMLVQCQGHETTQGIGRSWSS